MSINCIIVDDDLSSQSVLQHFIAKTDILHLVKTCSSASEAFKCIQLDTTIDLIFLDINMPNQSGLEFYKFLQHPPKVIFTTAYPQYAVEGFEVDALDYLLKPISYKRFLTAVGKAQSALSIPKEAPGYIVLNANKTLYKILFKDILYIEAYGDYVKVHTSEKTITTHSTFKGLKEKLPAQFMRVHKSYCINTNRLEQLSGNTIVIENLKIPIGLTNKEKVLKKLL